MTALLEVSGLRKQFGGLTAVKDVSFTLGPGTVTGILGPNGAGKTTLFIEHKLREMMRLVDRVIAMEFGEVIADGTPAQIGRDPRVIEAYLGREEPVDGVA